MEGFLDIDGTEIHEGDEILVSMNGSSTASDLERRKVIGFTSSFMKLNEGKYKWRSIKVAKHTCRDRVLILKGEMKEYVRKDVV